MDADWERMNQRKTESIESDLSLKQVVFLGSLAKRPRQEQRSVLVNTERGGRIAAGDGEGEGRPVVGGVAVGHQELENAGALSLVLLRQRQQRMRAILPIKWWNGDNRELWANMNPPKWAAQSAESVTKTVSLLWIVFNYSKGPKPVSKLFFFKNMVLHFLQCNLEKKNPVFEYMDGN